MQKKYCIVEKKHTAKEMGSGSLEVFATPALVALMEEAACLVLENQLDDEDTTTVGTEINVKHLGATPIGMKVWAQAKLVKQEGRSYFFEIEAFDEQGLIGTATHQRFLVKTTKFMEKTLSKIK